MTVVISQYRSRRASHSAVLFPKQLLHHARNLCNNLSRPRKHDITRKSITVWVNCYFLFSFVDACVVVTFLHCLELQNVWFLETFVRIELLITINIYLQKFIFLHAQILILWFKLLAAWKAENHQKTRKDIDFYLSHTSSEPAFWYYRFYFFPPSYAAHSRPHKRTEKGKTPKKRKDFEGPAVHPVFVFALCFSQNFNLLLSISFLCEKWK